MQQMLSQQPTPIVELEVEVVRANLSGSTIRSACLQVLPLYCEWEVTWSDFTGSVPLEPPSNIRTQFKKHLETTDSVKACKFDRIFQNLKSPKAAARSFEGV